MRRSVSLIVLVVIAGAAIIGAWLVGYSHGVTAGSSTAAADRSGFPTRAAGAPGAGGFPGAGGAGGFPGGAGGAPGGQAAGGQGGAPGGVPGSQAAGGATSQAGVTGKATKVDNGTITVQAANNTTVTVNTTTTTMVQKVGTIALTALKTGDFITIQGDKTSDTAYTAKMILSVGSTVPAGLIPSGTTGGAPSGSASAGQAPSGQASGAPRGGASGGLPAGFPSGPLGRITKIDGSTVTMQGLDGTAITVTASGSTTVQMLQPGAITDVKAGDTLIVQGDPAGTNTYNARVIIDQGATP